MDHAKFAQLLVRDAGPGLFSFLIGEVFIVDYYLYCYFSLFTI